MVLETTVGQALQGKKLGRVISVGPEELVIDALKTMAIHDIGALVVMENGQILGIITERDYARKVILENRSSRTTRVGEIMKSSVLFVGPEDPIEGCLQLMTNKRIRHMPVLDGDKLVGLVSMGDVVKTVISDQEFMIDELTRYLDGSYSGWFGPKGPGRATVVERSL